MMDDSYTDIGHGFNALLARWRTFENEHDLVHPDRGDCGGIGACSMMAHAHDLKVQMFDALEKWRTKS